MAVDGLVPTSGDFNAFVADLNPELTNLKNRAPIYLTSVSGTNTITATATPSSASLQVGMSFYLKPASDNTGAVTISINALSAVSIVDVTGSALSANSLLSTSLYLLVYDGTNLVIVTASPTPSTFYTLYRSAEQTVPAAAGTLSLTHGLGGEPDIVQIYFVCKTAEGGFSVNDVALFGTFQDSILDSATSSGLSVIVTSTQINMRSTGRHVINRADTGGGISITPANWRLKVKALRFV
jgi:hypothetical protein